MKKQIFHDAATGVLIGLILSIIFSLIYAPNTYAPLSPDSLIGQMMTQHQVHGALVLLYCTLIWAAIGILFNFGKRLFSRDWSLLRATLTHFFLMLVGFIPLATLAGWFPFHWNFYLQLIIEFAIVYLIIWTISYKRASKKWTISINSWSIESKNLIISKSEKETSRFFYPATPYYHSSYFQIFFVNFLSFFKIILHFPKVFCRI